MLTGDNGLIGKTGEAKNATEKSQEKEELEVAVIRFTDKRGNLDATKIVNGLNKDVNKLNSVTATDGKFPVKVEYKNGHKYQITKDGDIMISVNAGDTAPEDSNAMYSSGDYTAVIPAGFTVSGTPGETSIENGLVVTDSKQNEWVWIPVSSSDLDKMYEQCSSKNELLIENNVTKVVTQYKSSSSIDVRSDLTRGNPNSTSYREPGILAHSSCDKNDACRKEAGFVEADGTTASSLETMATKLKDDYKDMIESVRENSGFYIGRYELGKDSSNNPQVKAGTVINQLNWYQLYSKCKSFSNDNVESRMIWGCQWDQVCRFIKNSKDINGEQITLDNSSTYGNYSSSTDNKTGTRNYCITNNIYDLAGNLSEYTQEAACSYDRARRGRKF